MVITWQVTLFIMFVLMVCIFMLYVALMEYIAESNHKEIEIKNLLGGPETLIHAMRRVSGEKYINNLKNIKL